VSNGLISQEVNWLGRHVDWTATFCDEVKKRWSHTSNLPPRLHGLDSGEFTWLNSFT